jgi:Zn-finger nucleic acid-binding protein
MECPVCRKELREVTAGTINAEVCSEGCGGLWFDAKELRKAERAAEAETAALIAASPNRSVVARPERLHCPRDPAIVMQQHFESAQGRITVDECPQCGGIWLDPGELAVILRKFQTGTIGRNETQEALDMTFLEMQAIESIRDEQRIHEVEGTARFIKELFKITP